MMRIVGFWFILLAFAFANGALRELLLKNVLGIHPLPAHQISCLTGIILWTLGTLFFWKKLHIYSLRDAYKVGFMWFLMTILFETFVLNRNLSWSQIFETYNLLDGEFWGLVLLWIGLMPIILLFFKNQNKTT